jgi:hypothetical protein
LSHGRKATGITRGSNGKPLAVNVENLVPLIRWASHGIGTVSGAVQRWKKVKTMRLINADALYKDICRAYDECGDILEIIDKQPTIEPRKGHWIKKMKITETTKYSSYDPRWYCSYCNTEYDPAIAKKINFCWNCGADMKGE